MCSFVLTALKSTRAFGRNNPQAKRYPLPALLVLVAVLAGNGFITTAAQTVRIVTTVAGLTRSVYGNGGPAAQATINYSHAVAVDSAGNLYIADTVDQQIRKIDASTGVITTVAGNGQRGFSGDGQLAVNAQLSFPDDVAVDSVGNIYIADTGNWVIRKVSASTGIITTIAGTPDAGGYSGDGGPATKALLYYPEGMAVDASGNVYIADTNNNRVRKVTAATGIISTVAGDGNLGSPGDGGPATSATLSPGAVALDSSGNLYIAVGCAVRKVTIATGIISDYAGNYTCGDSGDGGAATAAELGYELGHISLDSAGDLYIADYSNNAVRKVTTSTGVITTIAGNGSFGFSGDGGPGTSAALNNPEGVAAAANGAIYIADLSNLRIREVSAAGTISTIAGNGTTGPVPTNVQATSTPVGVYGNRWYSSLAADALGNIYFADTLNNVIRKLTPAGALATIAGTGVAGYSGDGGPATSAELNNPDSVAFDAQGNLYIADSENNVIRKVNASTGIITTYAGTYAQYSSVGVTLLPTGDGGPATSAGLPAPTGLAVDSAGNLYIAEWGWCVVRKVTPAGIISLYAGQLISSTPNPCSFANAGDGGPATSAGLSVFAASLALDSQGNLYIGDLNAVREVTATTGIINTVVGSKTVLYDDPDAGDGGSASSATLSQIYGLTLDSGGNLYIADDYAIREVTPQGIITTAAGQDSSGGYSGDGGLATSAHVSADGVAVDSSGNIYFTDSLGNRVRKVSTASGTQPAAATPAFDPVPGNFSSNPTVTISTTTPGAQIFYTLDGSTPNPGTSPLYTSPVSLATPVTLSAIAIAPGYSTSAAATGLYTTGQGSQTITFGALPNVTYGVSPITLGATASSGLAVSYSVTGPASVSGSTLALTGAGTVTVTASQPGNSNYLAAASVTQSFTAAKAPLTVTADNATMVFGGPFPSFTYTITGFVNQDGAGNIAGSAFETTTATATSPPGTYPITFSTEGFSSSNYTFTYVSGTLTIVAAIPGVTLSPATLTFSSQGVGSTSAAQTITLTNSGNSPLTITGIAVSGPFAQKNTCTANAIAPTATCAISVTFSPTAGGALTGTLTLSDNASNSPQTVSLSGTGADVSIATTSTGMTVASGSSSATASIQVGSAGSFSGMVNLTCSVAYQGSGTAQDSPTCSLNPAQEQVSSGTPVSAILTVNTTPSGGSARLNHPWLPFGGGALAALFFFVGLPRRRWKKLGLLILLTGITTGATLGCGGGSSTTASGGGTPANPGTTAGNYMVTVTATSASGATETTSLTIPLSVQ